MLKLTSFYFYYNLYLGKFFKVKFFFKYLRKFILRNSNRLRNDTSRNVVRINKCKKITNEYFKNITLE